MAADGEAGARFCRNCGASMTAAARFCPQCATEVIPADEPLPAPTVGAEKSAPDLPPLSESGTAASAAATKGTPRRGRSKLLAVGAFVLIVLLGGGAAFLLLGGDDDTETDPDQVSSAGTASPTTDAAPAGTESTTSTESETPDTMPDLVGESYADAFDRLRVLGVEVEEVPVLDESATSGTVVGQTPSAGERVTTTATLEVARELTPQYLEELDPVGGNPARGSVEVDGEPYPNSVSAGLGCNSPNWELVYVLGKDYRTFEAVAGLTTDSPADTVMRFEVFVDGQTKYAKELTVGTAEAISADLTGGLQLKLLVSFVTGDPCARETAAWADAKLLGLPGEIPTTSVPG